jgi:heat shock protein HslJ
MRRTNGFTGLIAVIAIAVAACTAAASPSTGGAGAGTSPTAATAGSPPLTDPDLIGTEWLLGDLPGQVLADVRPTISFSGDGTVEGNAGCNTFSGTYTVDGSNLTLGPLNSTRMACEGAKGTLETAFLAAIQATTTYEITDAGELKLTSGATTLTFTKAT